MGIVKITLTEDHLKLISNIKFDKFNFPKTIINKANEEFIFENKELKKEILSLRAELQKYNSDEELRTTEFPDILIQTIPIHEERFGWGVDQNNLFGGTFILEQIALIIGRYNEKLEHTKEDEMGFAFPDKLEEYMWSLYNYIKDNLIYIESLVHFFTAKGGLAIGTYKCLEHEMWWEKIN